MTDKVIFGEDLVIPGSPARAIEQDDGSIRWIANGDDATEIRKPRAELTFDFPQHSGLLLLSGLS